MKHIVLCAALAAILAVPVFPALAQAPETADEVAQFARLREQIRADRRAVVAANLPLTEAQAKVFWPIYDQFQKELGELQRRRARVILEVMNSPKLGDEYFKKLAEEALQIGVDDARLHRRTFDRLAKVIPVPLAARYMQIEFKIDAVWRYDLARTIDLAK